MVAAIAKVARVRRGRRGGGLCMRNVRSIGLQAQIVAAINGYRKFAEPKVGRRSLCDRMQIARMSVDCAPERIASLVRVSAEERSRPPFSLVRGLRRAPYVKSS